MGVPGLVLMLLRWAAGPMADDIEGDLSESMERWRESEGPVRARRRGSWIALRMVPGLIAGRIGDRIRGSTGGRGDGLLGSSRMLASLGQGIRAVRRQPGINLLTALVLALGIGGATTILTIVDGVLLRPMPYPESDRLLLVSEGAHSWPDFRDWRETVPGFERLTAATGMTFTLEQDRLLEVEGARVSGDFWDIFGVGVARGRLPTPGEHALGVRVAVLTYPGWTNRWGGDPDILGRSIRISGADYEIVGVLDQDFVLPEVLTGSAAELMIPVNPADPALTRDSRSWGVVGRLAPGATQAGVGEALHARAIAYLSEVPSTADEQGNPRRTFAPMSLTEATAGDIVPALWILLAGSALLLAVACADGVGLLFAHGESRAREFAIRQSLGAGRGSLLTQLISEGAVLGAGAGIAALAVSIWGTRLVLSLHPDGIPRAAEITVDGRVALAGMAIALLTGIAASILPALRSSRDRSSAWVRGDAGGAGGSRRRGGRRRRLPFHPGIAAEAALASILVVGALGMSQVFLELTTVDPGFDPDGVVAVALNVGRDVSEPVRTERVQAITESLASMPGVTSVGAGFSVPFEVAGGSRCCYLGSIEDDDSEIGQIWVHPVTPGYLTAIRARFAEGAAWEPSQATEGVMPVILNRTAAEELAPGVRLTGSTVRFAETEMRVAGVIEDVHHWGADQPIEPEMYLPWEVEGVWSSGLTFAVRTDGSLGLGALRDRVLGAAPGLILEDAQPMSQVMAASLERQRFQLIVLGAFAALALALAIAGLFGSLVYSLRRRRRELGIRVALGASVTRLVSGVVGPAAWTILVGGAAGLGAALLLARYLEDIAPGLNLLHPLVLGAFGIALLIASLPALWVPTRMVARTDPREVINTT